MIVFFGACFLSYVFVFVLWLLYIYIYALVSYGFQRLTYSFPVAPNIGTE